MNLNIHTSEQICLEWQKPSTNMEEEEFKSCTATSHQGDPDVSDSLHVTVVSSIFI